MQKDPFVILGVDDQVTQNELYEAYKKARAEWEPKRFAIGDEGAEACEKLDEIEAAYREADEILKSRYFVSSYVDVCKQADELIKQGKYDEAQSVLDGAVEHSAEWHFLESIVLYSKGLAAEAREHLVNAVNLEPGNAKYVDALKRMDSKASGNRDTYRPEGSERSNIYASKEEGERSYRDDNVYATGRGVTPCDCCSSLLCADCCCECMGGDLIACC